MCLLACKIILGLFVFLVGIHYGRLGKKTKCPRLPPSRAEELTATDPCPIIISSAATATSNATATSDALCKGPAPRRSLLYLHKNDVSTHTLKENSVLRQVFGSLHHPETPVKAEVILSRIASDAAFADFAPEDGGQSRIVPLPSNEPFAQCREVFLTRSGARESMPNKCVAVVHVPADHSSPTYLSHRYGIQAKMVDRYVGDWATDKKYLDEAELLPQLLRHLTELVAQFNTLLGSPFVDGGVATTLEGDAGRERRSVLVMVANEGVMDLLLNFLCSCRSAGLNTGSMVVFVGQPEYIPLVHAIGAKAFYSTALGLIPRKAADSYGDNTFARLMWLKATSVFIGARAGFHVLFQDVDLVWLRDPFPFLQAHVKDIAFMDDGARTTRFTPFFVNSGFYYMKHNARTLFFMERMLKCAAEISSTHSHQATLTRYLTELHSTFHLDIAVLPELLFPSGAQWHNNKKFVAQMLAYEAEPEPFVFHMCWTATREDKVTYLKALGLWLLPPAATPHCEAGPEMMKMSERTNDLAGSCCQRGRYFEAREAHAKENAQQPLLKSVHAMNVR